VVQLFNAIKAQQKTTEELTEKTRPITTNDKDKGALGKKKHFGVMVNYVAYAWLNGSSLTPIHLRHLFSFPTSLSFNSCQPYKGKFSGPAQIWRQSLDSVNECEE